MLFDSGFLQNWRAELKKMNKGKEGANYHYPNSLILLLLLLLATVHMHVPTSIIPSIRRLSSNDVNSHKETQGSSTRFHNNLVESRKDEDKPGLKHKSRKNYIVITAFSTVVSR